MAGSRWGLLVNARFSLHCLFNQVLISRDVPEHHQPHHGLGISVCEVGLGAGDPPLWDGAVLGTGLFHSHHKDA